MQEMLISLLENKSYKEMESEFIVSAAEYIENIQINNLTLEETRNILTSNIVVKQRVQHFKRSNISSCSLIDIKLFGKVNK